MHLEPVPRASKNIKATCLDQGDGMVYIQFQNDDVYRYNMPAEIYHDMLMAESIGEYFNKHVRKVYPGVKL